MIKPLLLATAIGDAFGAGIEFQDRDWIRANVDFSQFVNARERIAVPKERIELFTKNYQAWDYTDDTEMTIGIIKALISNRSFTEDLLVEYWKAEYDRGIALKGYGRNGHGSMAWYYSGEKTIEEIRDFQRNRPNPGNAPAMRAVPLGLIAEDLINSYAAINANATHPNINAVLASQCVARAAHYMLVLQGDARQLINYCQDTVDLNEAYRVYLDAVDQLGRYEELGEGDFEVLCGSQPIQAPYFLAGIKGVPSDAKYTTGCVLYILKHSRNAMDALRQSVYMGGDIDSLASITTGIMAGRTGLESLPAFMLEEVEGVEYIGQLAEKWAKWKAKLS